MPATKVGKIQSARYHRASNGSLIKPAKQSNTERCIDYIEDTKGDKTLQNDLIKIDNDTEAKSNGTQEFLINYAFNKHKKSIQFIGFSHKLFCHINKPFSLCFI